MAYLLASAVPTGYGGAGGSEIPPRVSRMYIWYQSAPVPSPAPPLPGGWWEGPPEGGGVPLQLTEADPPLWRGVDDSFCSGRRWMAVRPVSGWVPICSHQGLVDSCPAASQRLLQTESRFGLASMEVIYHWDGHQES